LSGEERLQSHRHSIEFFFAAPLSIQLFGLGFGATRPFSFLDWLLINCGIVGTSAWLGAFLWPLVGLPTRDPVGVGLKLALGVALFAMLVGVTEFSYPTTWLFLGLAYSPLGGGANE